ncbi:hypothetical protein [Actinomadura geliboluensis]|uniref:hypothetical protein n=1 Tax=Actinomadura geliboluensis TaxID=882440 RepID=UPI0014873EAB|nr:hypothetical protein [Actinomadura geliboluensis]
MNETTDVADPIARAKAPLQRDFPEWNIVYSSANRWWAFLDPKRRGRDTAPTRTTAVDADTSEGLYELLTTAVS